MNPLIRSFRFVLVLSLIGSGFMFLSNLIYALTLPAMMEVFQSGAFSLPEQYQVALDMILSTPRSFYALSALLYALSLTGVILMWKLRMNGFHCYTLAQLLLLLLPLLFLGKDRLALGDIMLTLLFVCYYFFTLRRILALQQDDPQQEDDTAAMETHGAEDDESHTTD